MNVIVRYGLNMTVTDTRTAPVAAGGCPDCGFMIAVATNDEAARTARDELLANMPAGHLRLLQGLQLAFVHHDYLFTHAGLSPEARLSEQTEDDLLWGPDGFLEAKGPFEKFVVHGHTWRGDEPELLGHRIGLDTGAYATGVLTAVRIEDGDHRPLQALDEGAVERRAAEADARAPRLVQRPADYVSAPAAELGGLFARPTLHAADLG